MPRLRVASAYGGGILAAQRRRGRRDATAGIDRLGCLVLRYQLKGGAMRGSRATDRWFVALGLGLVLAVAVTAVAGVRVALAGGSTTTQAATAGGAVIAVKMIGEGSLDNDGVIIGGYTQWTAIPGALDGGTVLRVKVTVPAGHTAVFRATLSGDAYCSSVGEGECAVRVVANGKPFVPQSSGFGNSITEPGNPYSATSTQFYTPHPYPAGTYTITAQARFPHGANMGFLSNLLTVDEIQAS